MSCGHLIALVRVKGIGPAVRLSNPFEHLKPDLAFWALSFMELPRMLPD